MEWPWGWSWVLGAADHGLRSLLRVRPERPDLSGFTEQGDMAWGEERSPGAEHQAQVQGQVPRPLGLQALAGTLGQSPLRGHLMPGRCCPGWFSQMETEAQGLGYDDVIRAGEGRGWSPACCLHPLSSPAGGEGTCSQHGPRSRRTPPTLLLVWPVTEAQIGQKDTGPAPCGSDVSTSDQAGQALSVPIHWDLSEVPELCTRPAVRVADGSALSNRSPGQEACPRGGTPAPLPPRSRGWRTRTTTASCPWDSAGRDQAYRMSLIPCLCFQWWTPCGSSQSSDGDQGAPKDGARPQPEEGSRPRPGVF